MAQSISQVNGCDLVVKLDNGSGIPIDISGSSNSVNTERLVEVGSGVKTFGSSFPIRAACGKDANISLKAVYSGDDAEATFMLNDWYENHHKDHRTLQVDCPDSLPGSDRYIFEVFLTSLKIDYMAGQADPILVEATFKPTGTFSWAVVAS